MKILVTGGSGFIGRHLLWNLEKVYPEAALINFDKRDPEVATKSTFIKGDICDEAAVAGALQGVDAVIHLAAAHSDFGISREDYFRINETGTRTILGQCTKLGIRRFTNFSSVAVYGNATPGADENSPTLPENNYGESKLAAERVVREWAASDTENRAVIIRPAVVIGPWHKANMLRLITQIDRGHYLFNLGRCEHIKSVASVQNLAAFAAQSVRSDFSTQPLELFNYVDYPQLCVHRTVEVIHEELGRRMPRITFPLKLAEIAALPFDLAIKLTGRNLPISSARVRKLGTSTKFEGHKAHERFPASMTVEDCLRSMVKWYLQQKSRKN